MTNWLRTLGPKAYIAAQRFLKTQPRSNLPSPTAQRPPPELVDPSGSPLSLLQPTRRQFLKGAASAGIQSINPLNAPNAVRAIANTLTPKELTHLMAAEYSPLQRMLHAMETRAQTEDETMLLRNDNSWDVGDLNDGDDASPFGLNLPLGLVGKADRFVKNSGWNPEDVGFDNTPVQLVKKAAAEAKDPRDLQAFIDVVEADRRYRMQTIANGTPSGYTDRSYPRPHEYTTPVAKDPDLSLYKDAKVGVRDEPEWENTERMDIDGALKLTPEELRANAGEIQSGFVFEQWDSDYNEAVPTDLPKQQELLRKLERAARETLHNPQRNSGKPSSPTPKSPANSVSSRTTTSRTLSPASRKLPPLSPKPPVQV